MYGRNNAKLGKNRKFVALSINLAKYDTYIIEGC
jgi:hypothetical protein